MVFLDNNHEQWLKDVLFGQFQIGRRNSLILSVEQLLKEFEQINRPKRGPCKGFVVNPIASIDFAKLFGELGYETKSPTQCGFKSRNIHLAVTCRQGARKIIDADVLNLF